MIDHLEIAFRRCMQRRFPHVVDDVATGMAYGMWKQALEQQGWELVPLDWRGRTVAIALVNGPEFHFETLEDDAAWAVRALERRVVQPLLEAYGFVTTTVMVDNPAGMAFCRRLGFEDEESPHNGMVRLYRKEFR